MVFGHSVEHSTLHLIHPEHQTTDPRISEDTKDKYKTKPNNTAPYTYTDCIQTAENKDKTWHLYQRTEIKRENSEARVCGT